MPRLLAAVEVETLDEGGQAFDPQNAIECQTYECEGEKTELSVSQTLNSQMWALTVSPTSLTVNPNNIPKILLRIHLAQEFSPGKRFISRISVEQD